MKRKILLLLLGLLVVLSLAGCAEGDPLPEDLYTKNIYPGTTGTYDLGSAALKWDDIWCVTGHFDAHSMYLGDTLLTEEMLIALLAGGEPESGGGDMYKSVYDPDYDGFIAEAQLALNYATHAPYTLTKAEVEAVLTGEITTHTHPGNGGSSIVIKSGTITTDGSGNGTVTFTTAFADTNYAISLTADAIGVDAVIAIYGSKAVDSFSVQTLDDGGKSEANVTIDWIAIEYTNE